jgi:deoxyribonuclease-1
MKFIHLILLLCVSVLAVANGNASITSFNNAKKLLQMEVYNDHRETVYCAAAFDAKKNVIIPTGFTTDKYRNGLRELNGNTLCLRKASAEHLTSGAKDIRSV